MLIFFSLSFLCEPLLSVSYVNMATIIFCLDVPVSSHGLYCHLFFSGEGHKLFFVRIKMAAIGRQFLTLERCLHCDAEFTIVVQI
jgi:hypothetical protein